MDLFRADGHLRNEALNALIHNQPLNELKRLEIAEHLAYCDLCLQRYTNALTEDTLLTPRQSCRDTIGQRIRTRTIRIFSSRYATAVAAVAVALTLLWADLPLSQAITAERPALVEQMQGWPDRWNDSIGSIMERFNHFFEGRSDPDNGGNTR